MIADTHNLLLGLAWLGELTTTQIRRLWLPGQHETTVRTLLRELRQEGYVTRRRWALPQERVIQDIPVPPVIQPALWSITRKARDQLREEDQFPPVYKEPRARRSVPHDVMTSETIVRIIEVGRALRTPDYQGISGLYVEREVRLDPDRPRPVMDALIIVTIGGTYPDQTVVPWSRDPKSAGETRVRYALENDRHSEPLTVIQGKAYAYQQASTPQWVKRYGAVPLVMWVTTKESRLEGILRVWREAWPQGKWLMTIDPWLAGDYWLEYDRGQVTYRGLFTKTPTPPPRLPPAGMDPRVTRRPAVHDER